MKAPRSIAFVSYFTDSLNLRIDGQWTVQDVVPATEARFEYAVAMNWDKKFVTHIAAETMRLLGYQPETMFRPRVLEDPKLALSWFLILVAMAASVLLYGIYRALLLKGGHDDRNPHEIAMS